MPYNEKIASRITEVLAEKGVVFTEKKMFSGVCFLVDDKMLCGTHIDKQTNESLLLCRLSNDDYNEVIEKPHCMPMNFTGKIMKGYVFISEQGFKTKKQLSEYLQLCLNFNPLAKASKKK